MLMESYQHASAGWVGKYTQQLLGTHISPALEVNRRALHGIIEL